MIVVVRPRLELCKKKATEGRADGHTLEFAFSGGLLASKCNLRRQSVLGDCFDDSLVGDIAHLVILFDNFATSVTDAVLPQVIEAVTNFVLCADIAVEARPAIVAFTGRPVARWSVLASGQGTAHYGRAVRFEAAITSIWKLSRRYLRGSKQSSPPNPSGQSHFPLYLLHFAKLAHELAGRLQSKLCVSQNSQ